MPRYDVSEVHQTWVSAPPAAAFAALSHVVTETRVVGTDERATRLFRRYWFVIGWASGAIRRSWLNALRRKIARG